MAQFKLRLWDERACDMESVWAEDTDTVHEARLLNTPIMFNGLAIGSIVRWEDDPRHGRLCRRSDGVTGDLRQQRIDAVWNGEDLKRQ